MLKRLIHQRISAFGREYGYNVAYLEEMLEADLGAVMRFSRLQGISQYRKGVPIEVSYAAAIQGTMAEDCGPCTQLMVTMAEREGVPAAILRAVLDADEDAMGPDVRLAVRFCRAVLDRDPRADTFRDEIVRSWGKRGLLTIAFRLTAARLYPTVKYALGHGRACSRIRVGDTSTVVNRDTPAMGVHA